MNAIGKTAIGLVFALLLSPARAADINAGKSRAAACMGCHGSAGVSNSGLFPSLAGQSRTYLEAQLKHFRSGERVNATMNAMAKDLKDEEIQNLAAYYAGLPGKSAGGDAKLAAAGKEKAAMCMGCHGNELRGNGQFPKLAGQHPDYIARQLTDFKSGARKAGPMNPLAQSLSEDDIKALAEYAGSLH
ncbi:cytochrome c4 [Methylomonas sp. SURF-2]|uniref:Cytochrome c4 n=1 Tax=Methylomonas subterranea TaxID=2952225 RepID=A0ABT1TH17_9GAMM|nr:c-type cytochrome [Methylomonas sp. SURF-2]MCQ8104759.1 cytochrome c4 [Methylomonas sp. SURF-2]